MKRTEEAIKQAMETLEVVIESGHKFSKEDLDKMSNKVALGISVMEDLKYAYESDMTDEEFDQFLIDYKIEERLK